MNKKSDSVNLQFFTQSTINAFQREIDQVVTLVKTGRLSFEKALRRLHTAKDDLQVIYWHVMNCICQAQGDISTLRDYQSMKGLGYDIELTEDELQTLLIQRVHKAANQRKQGASMEIKRVSQVDQAHDDLADILPIENN
jgi:hypothetical protein